MHTLLRITLTALLFVAFQTGYAMEFKADDETHWWDGFSITPGGGFRHLGISIDRKSDGYHGNISNAGFAQAVATLNMTFNEFKLNEGGTLYLELHSYTAFLKLDHQFYDYGTTNTATGANSGERVDVDTRIDGYYTYLMPSLKFKAQLPGSGEFAVSLGVGLWTSEFSGDIILTDDGRPINGMPKSDININTYKELAYIFNMSYATTTGWIYLMSVGGTTFDDDEYDYKIEEVAMIIGKRFQF